MLIIDGYKLESQNPKEIKKILSEMKKKIENEGERLYRHLFEREAENLVDDISLNVIPRPEISIYDLALIELNERIAYATGRQNVTEFNFNVSVHVLYDDSFTYFKVNANNPAFQQKFKNIEELQDISLLTKGIDDKGANFEFWESIMARYKDISPLGVQLYPSGPIDIKDDILKFRTPAERAEERARHNLANRLLSTYAGEKEIPNFKLMQRLDEALNALTSPESKEELHSMKINLLKTLPNITLDLIQGSHAENIENKEIKNNKEAK